MPRWYFILVGALMCVAAAWWINLLTREPSDASRLHEVYRQQCPEYVAAHEEAYRGVSLGGVPNESAALTKLEAWRSGDLEAIRCQILFENAANASMEAILEHQNASQTEIAASRAGRSRQLFALRYFLWLKTGEGAPALETLARSMFREDVDSAVTLWIFHDDAAPDPILDARGRIAPEDPGYRFVEMARPDELKGLSP